MEFRTDYFLLLYFLVGAEAVEPFLMSGWLQQFGDGRKRLLAIAQHGYVGLDVLVYLGRVDIEVDDFSLRSIGRHVARHTVVEAHAHGYQHIALVGIDVRPQIAMHTQHALVQRMVGRQGRKSQQGTSGRQFSLLNEGSEFGLGITQLYPLPYEYQWALSGINEIGSLADGFHIHVGHGLVTADKVNRSRFIFHLVHLCILGKVEHHRTRTATTGNVEGTRHGPRHIFGPTNLVTPLGDGLSDAYEVHFLKGIRTEETCTYLPGNNHDGRTVYHGVGNAGNGIGGTRSAGYEADTYLTRHTGKALCGMGSALFVAHQNVVQRLPMVV